MTPTHEELEVQLLEARSNVTDLRSRLATSCDDLQRSAARVRALTPIKTQALELAAAWHGHPWTNQAVFDAGTELIETVRKEAGLTRQALRAWNSPG